MDMRHDLPAIDGAARASVLWAVAASITTSLTVAYAFGLWGDTFFPVASGLPYTDEFAPMERLRFAAASAVFGFLALVPPLAVLYTTSRSNAQLLRELSDAKARAAAFATELENKG